jgi:hypothetical protein
MKTRYAVALAVLAGVGIGGAATQSLHAQTGRPVYLVTEIDVTDPGAYDTEYAPKVQASVKASPQAVHALAICPSG